ncbi:copper-binding protein [Roseateles aquatilis]|nr:copper-binding protein [Roseateles aquatilis]
MNRNTTSALFSRSLLSVAFAAAWLAAAPAQAQGHMHHNAEPASAAASDGAAPSSQDWIAAEVRRVDGAQGRLTLKHGDIRHLDMPGMTMPFRLKPGLLSAEQLAALKVGDKVEVRVESQQGRPVIIELRPMPAR